jgi:hypothetical protein
MGVQHVIVKRIEQLSDPIAGMQMSGKSLGTATASPRKASMDASGERCSVVVVITPVERSHNYLLGCAAQLRQLGLLATVPQ